MISWIKVLTSRVDEPVLWVPAPQGFSAQYSSVQYPDVQYPDVQGNSNHIERFTWEGVPAPQGPSAQYPSAQYADIQGNSKHIERFTWEGAPAPQSLSTAMLKGSSNNILNMEGTEPWKKMSLSQTLTVWEGWRAKHF